MAIRLGRGKGPTLTDSQTRMVGLFDKLEAIYSAYDLAAGEITRSTGKSICVEGCGLCCHNSVMSFGIEAEHAVSYLLGQPWLLKETIGRIREWLTRPGEYTYGKGLTTDSFREHQDEWYRIMRETCPLLTEDRTCLLHWARPLVCRAYGVSHMPHRECRREIGLGEDADSRAWWDGHSRKLPLYNMVNLFLSGMTERRFQREGFFVTMIFERLAAKELVGLVDDGKIPLMKLAVGLGPHVALLWQEQMEADWRAQAADESIGRQIPLKTGDDGNMHLYVEVK